MSNEQKQQETLLQTIKANLIRNEEGIITFYLGSQGSWDVTTIPNRCNSGLIKYFEPSYEVGFDKYGSPLNDKQLPTL